MTENGTKEQARIAALEEQLQLAAWLIAEGQHRTLKLAATVAAMVAQQMQPQVQQSVLNQLMNQ